MKKEYSALTKNISAIIAVIVSYVLILLKINYITDYILSNFDHGLLFNDMYVSGVYYKDGDGRMISYKNMLMNIPQNLQNLCSDINCNDCKEYYEAILHKYYLRLW